MKLVLTVFSVLFFCYQTTALPPFLAITPKMELKLYGHPANYYQLESSTNLVNWNQVGAYFPITISPFSLASDVTTQTNEFFRVKCLTSTENLTYSTLCAENDNVLVFLRGDVAKYSITATHPTYTVTDYRLWDDTNNCTSSHVYPSYPYKVRSIKMYDGGFTNDVVWVYSSSTFWRSNGMTVTVNGNISKKETNVQYLALSRYIPNSYGEWPQYLVLYCDGNMRLIPFPPTGHGVVSFGSSVIVGPADMAYSTDSVESRPVCDIESVDVKTITRQLLVTYRNGGSSVLEFSNVTRTASVVNVTVNHPTDKPFCTFRSNFVSAQKCDASTVVWRDSMDMSRTNGIESSFGQVGREWFFTRFTPSNTRNSAPDIRIFFY